MAVFLVAAGGMATAPAFPAASRTTQASPGAPLDQLWTDPVDLSARDLYYGPGGRPLAPKTGVVYRFRKEDTQGHSGGYDVDDPEGRVWDVKIGDEAQSETAVSRILWAIGFHQPVTYYVARWRMQGGPTSTPEAGRFRLESDHKNKGDWNWAANPFVDTRPCRGLLIANVLLNNWDLAASNNRVYHVAAAPGGAAHWFVVQDVGAALGKNGWPLGSRNDIDDFESQGFVAGVEGGRVRFEHQSRHEGLLKEITPADVVWTCRLLARLSDRQLDDAFRAAGYPREVRERFAAKIRSKIRQGLALTPRAGNAG